ncbi:hypothetical protein K9M42_01535 [Patescibacteria group bacterium]|nr:hypothetical protein [Patescibacteria group bacterium]
MKKFYKNKKRTTYSSRNKYVFNRNKKRISAKKRKLFFRFFLFFFLILLIIVNIYYLFFISSVFKIESVDIYIESENINNDYSDIEENINFFVNSQMILKSSYFKNKKQDRLFLFNKDYLKEKIQNEYKNILHDINIYKKYPDRLKIELKKRIPAVLFVSFDGIYYTDKEGYVVYKIKDNITPTVEVLEDSDNHENLEEDPKKEQDIEKAVTKKDKSFIDISDYYNLNDSEIVDLESLSLPTVFIEEELDFYNLKSLEKNYINFIKIILNRLPKIDFGIANIKIPTLNDSKLIVTTNKNYNLYFNLNKDPEKQVKYLNIFLSEREENKIRGINYIDLRFDSRIFYK